MVWVFATITMLSFMGTGLRWWARHVEPRLFAPRISAAAAFPVQDALPVARYPDAIEVEVR